MKKTDNEETADDVNFLAKKIGLPYQVRLSPELSEMLNPNEFLKGMGIQFSDRLNSILNILKGSLIPKISGSNETMPESGIIIPIPVVKGPYIREEMVSVKAEMADDNGNAEILLTVILETE
jgi:hypothetical protein